jgi:hypothetical protein
MKPVAFTGYSSGACVLDLTDYLRQNSMREDTVQLEAPLDITADPRWELVERIVTSPGFARSPRLCSFLMYICDLSLRGRAEEISEVNIGRTLFDRGPNYDPSVDGIVRSHASRLRQRLDQYFNEEGAHETILLLIPKGGYTPVFEARSMAPHFAEGVPFAEPEAAAGQLTPETTMAAGKDFRLLWILSAALALACAAIVYLVMHPQIQTGAQVVATRHPLWERLFGPDHSTMIVASDTGLTTLQTLTDKNVPLAAYLSGDYRTHNNSALGAPADLVGELGMRRYTSIVDLDIVTKLYQLPGVPLNRIQVRYARDVHPNDLKGGPVILLGAQEGTPWVELFEEHMNFVFLHDHAKHSFVVLNRSPRDGEMARYESDHRDPQHTVYGLIALQPNLEGSGQILILEGTSMAGTESAADFVFDDARLLPFLDRIKMRNGALPYFELLLQSNSMNGSASQSEILAYRTSAN